MLHHPTRPYREHWEDPGQKLDGLFEIADRYLRAVNEVLQLPEPWLDDLVDEGAEVAPPFKLQWLRDQSDPRQSYRSGGAAGTAVLLAGLCAPSKAIVPLFGGQGLRVIVHIDPNAADGKNARITGVTSTLPLWSGTARDALEAWGGLGERVNEDFLGRLGRNVLDVCGLGTGWGVADRGLRVPDAWQGKRPSPTAFYALAKTVPSEEAAEKISYLVVGRLTQDLGIEQVSIEPLVAGVDARAQVFKRDPISKNGAAVYARLRPSRSWKVLDGEREPVVFPNLSAGAKPGTVKLEDPDGNFRVTNSRYAKDDHGLNEHDPKEVDKTVAAHVRTNTFAAVNAYYHTSELFRRMKDYGFVPASYFAFVNRPISVRYRAGIHPGAQDGRTINAQVRWTLQPAGAPGDIEVCFALADLQSSVAKSPLGIASDSRWCWHEFSHVLLIAATGQKEFSFAHSAGDALAAIVCDPDSRLAVKAGGDADNEGAWRGVTFPWVFQSRRHDRDVADGWSWTGALYQKELFFAPPQLCNKRGYWAEQLLSSALFRLYRGIGGDAVRKTGQPVPDTDARRAASDYVVYLIMKAIQLAGKESTYTPMSPVQFVDTLIQAEISVPSVPVATLKYAPGTVHKVIRWAFEQQGLIGNPVPGSLVVGPESDMRVDLHIDDRRDKKHGPYTPVTFRDDNWQAHPDAVWVQNAQAGRKRDELPRPGQDNFVYVRVQNRGPDPVANASVDVWSAEVGASGDPPPFPDSTRWHHLGNAAANVAGAAGGVPGEAPPLAFKWPASAAQPPLVKNKRYAILVSATCVDDMSNLDPSTAFACATAPGAIGLSYVVACDNNLGLRVVTAT